MSDYFTPDGYISMQQVREELRDLGFDTEQIGQIVDPFWFQDYYANFIAIPPVIEQLKAFVTEKGHAFRRIDFYKYYFDYLIEDENLRKELQLVGVEFEKLQRNDFTKEILGEVIEKVDAKQLSFNLLDQLGLVWERDGQLEWRHHTITEYFASEFILDSDDVINTAHDLIVLHIDADNTDNIKPSWHGVLKFLLESDEGSKVLDWLLDLIEQNPLNLEENLTNILGVYIPHNVTNKQKKRVFNAIYDGYREQKHLLWLPVWATSGLAKYFTEDQLEKLESDIEPTGDEFETLVRRGNVVAVIDELIQENLIAKKTEIKKWKQRFVDFAKDSNDNGVLQRRSLKALRNFDEKNGKLIADIKKEINLNDSMVREAFIQYCSATAPNSPEAIDVFIDNLFGRSKVYSRHALYQISSKEGFSYFLGKFIEDVDSLKDFIEDESVFSGDRKEPEREFIGQLLLFARQEPEIADKLKKLFSSIIQHKRIYQLEKSFFLRKVGKFLIDDESYFFGLIEGLLSKDEEDRNHGLYNLTDLLPELLNRENWEQVTKAIEVKQNDLITRYVQKAIYGLRFRTEEGGKELFEEIASKRSDIQKPNDQEVKEQQSEQDDEIYKEFKFKLEPAKGKFIPDVFEYFLNNKELIQERWSDYEYDRILHLAFDDGIKRLNPREFTVSFQGNKGRGARFKWSRQAVFYGKMIKVVRELDAEKLTNQQVQQHIIDFTPYAYSEDQKIIDEVVPDLSNVDLSWLIELYGGSSDRKYLLPESFIELVKRMQSQGLGIDDTLSSLNTYVFDDDISDWTRENALELIGEIRGDNNTHKKFLEKVVNEVGSDKLILEANSQLISIFDDEDAIDWRFEKIKKGIQPFVYEEGFHSVGSVEEELDTRSLVTPLLIKWNEKVLKRFKALTLETLEMYVEDERFDNFLNYVWKSTVEHAYLLEGNGFFTQICELSEWLKDVEIPTKKISYFYHVLLEARRKRLLSIMGGETDA